MVLSVAMLDLSLSFTPCTGLSSRKSYRTKLCAKRKRLTPIQRLQGGPPPRDPNELSEFDKVKKTLYSGIDTVQDAFETKKSGPKVVQGYSPKKAPPVARTKKVTPAPTRSLFDNVKSTAYGLADSIAPQDTNKPVPKPPSVVSLPVAAKIRTTIVNPNDLAQIQPDLDSSNPVTRTVAKAKLWQLEQQEKARMRVRETQETLNNIKKTAYAVGDGIQSGIDAAVQLPGKAQKVAKDTGSFIESVPGKTQEAIDNVKAIPTKIENAVNEVKEGVDSTVATTKQVIDDVKALPDTVKRMTEDVKQGVESALETINEIQYNTKVMLKMEKPKPRPPNRPPPEPLTASKVGLQVLGTVAKGTGKVALWAGKGIFGAMVEAAKKDGTVEAKSKKTTALPEKDTPTSDKSVENKQDIETKKIGSESAPNSKAAKPKAPKPPVEIDPDLDEQVRKALKMAADALEEAGEIGSDRPSS